MDTLDGWPQGRPPKEAPSQGHDVHVGLRITAGEAERGATVRFLLPDGRQTEMHVPAGLQEGTRLRLPGQGFQRKGDLLVHVQIIPEPE